MTAHRSAEAVRDLPRRLLQKRLARQSFRMGTALWFHEARLIARELEARGGQFVAYGRGSPLLD